MIPTVNQIWVSKLTWLKYRVIEVKGSWARIALTDHFEVPACWLTWDQLFDHFEYKAIHEFLR